MALAGSFRPLKNALARVMRVEVVEDEETMSFMTVPVLWAAVQELNKSAQEERLKRRALERELDELRSEVYKLRAKG